MACLARGATTPFRYKGEAKMTKEEKKRMYRELVEAGVKMPKACQFTTNDYVAEMHARHFPPKDAAETPQRDAEEKPQVQEERLPMLYFETGGWCDGLGRSYSRGMYKPQDRFEYLKLRPYALKEVWQ